jgi:hypothetical protein
MPHYFSTLGNSAFWKWQATVLVLAIGRSLADFEQSALYQWRLAD